MAAMTKDVIVASCKANGGYAAPCLNDQLFLHCCGFTLIQNLEPYKDVKVLWLEQNALSELSGLESQKDTLVSLFVQNNLIRSLSSLTATLHGLRVLNVSHNYLTSLHGIAAGCPSLETLQASHNQLTSLEVCEELWQLAGSLTSVDLSFNRIETAREPAGRAVTAPGATATTAAVGESECTADDGDVRIVDASDISAIAPVAVSTTAVALPKPDPLAIAQFFQHLPLVSVIYFQGNGLSHCLRHYRRNMILHLPALTYLDDRPIFSEERRVTEAWGRGGDTAEAAERATIREEKRAHLTRCVTLLTEQREEQRAVRDRLTRQLDQRRAQELEELTQRRRRDRDNRAAVESAEAVARDVVEKAEQDARWDAEELFQEAHRAMLVAETERRHAYEQRVAVLEDAATCSPDGFSSTCRDIDATDTIATTLETPLSPPSSVLAALLQLDDDVLKEMEMEIEHVLHDINSNALPTKYASTALDAGAGELDHSRAMFSGHQVWDRATLRMEKNVRAAVGHVSKQLRAQRNQQRRRSSDVLQEEVWQRFEEWKARRASQPLDL
ncbi:Leucine Rich repeats (2 copies) family protein [Leishmania donovani]|uniref:Leucine Rich repeats (2 copies) family protein n=1 Tax=Leishmania donovani TaxID=5661 RepID=A0A504X3U8_LEIDO|nr:Leucine Rich repeats (2 copies) family protein [Leishmania donovani]TPP47087.1 Leucine Rich repeats (2 copies) family protein [Leishmania donovani]